MWPELPKPVTISSPVALLISLVAALKGAPRSDCSAAVTAAMPPASASSVRRADLTAAFAESVPDDFAISGFGLAMSGSWEGGPGLFGPGALLSMARRVRRRALPA